jgi:hypothetical protein
VSKLRPLGSITTDLELLLDEMCIQHDMQHHEVLALVNASLCLHFPNSKEEFEDESLPPPRMKYE